MDGERRENLDLKVQDSIEKLTDINRKQEKRIQAVITGALTITNLHFMFQGVILSSASSPSPVKCNHWWIHFCLSLLAAILNLGSVCSAVHLFLKYSEELDQNYEHLQFMREQKPTGPQENREASETPLAVNDPVPRGPDSVTKWCRRILSYAALCLLLGFSGIVLYGCRALLCDSSH